MSDSRDDTAIVWFRRDLRVHDQPIFTAAAARARRSLAVFVLDERLLGPAGKARRTFLFRSLRDLDESLGGRLLVVRGDPVEAIPKLAGAVRAGSVHVAADFGPYGRERDEAVEKALGERDVDLVRTGSPYAVDPGKITKSDGEPYKVYTPFSREWAQRDKGAPADTDASTVEWMQPSEKNGGPRAVRIPADEPPEAELPEAGERAAHEHWEAFVDEHLADYDDLRDRPDKPATSRMSVYLKYGVIHPRQLLAGVGGSGKGVKGPESFRNELCFRDFYAAVLWFYPRSARENFDPKFDRMPYDSGPGAEERFRAWQEGRTGFPAIDAAMRQLRGQAWMHNRMRMAVASFLVKDLHLPWWRGARHFLQLLVDGDLPSNQHGWQWAAGTGTDAAPYFRVFNPVTQGERFDPQGEYVRRWVPELAGIEGKKVHQPWKLAEPPGDYPAPIVDHKAERQEALDRFNRL
ncbi:cryptochrome/photolyase family protein [Actinomycetospora cinnamomea]|uniref:Deoxyribodipyrimidine photo-lyase n=1 Tax=Actinomycetospora cinnamomea TaxID=663609 RepID=A0A2U1FM33_9PSEU|nr:deoxyribodipyrimidine photo-lyase [Actinomycetospora cinnamomea]PVZ13227.1 deoxyribodipyrimidine photo-lyase [Actinomycetospora cinnamomea]